MLLLFHNHSFVVSVLHILVTVLAILSVAGLRIDDDAIAEILQTWDGVGLVTWSLDATTGNLCSMGTTGERIKDSGQPMTFTGDSRHHIGSVTKSMTAVLLASLIEEGRFAASPPSSNNNNGWDTTLREIFVQDAGGNYGDVTLRQLVSMQAGIPSMPQDLSIMSMDPRIIGRLIGWLPFFWGAPLDTRTYREAMALTALYTAPENAPGQADKYSNWGYVVAGHIVEKITGQVWEDVLKERIFVPLGIDLGDATHNFIGAPRTETDPWGHRGDDLVPCNPFEELCDFPEAAAPAGSFSGPVAAMARYYAWHIQCHNGDIPIDDPAYSILTQESCQLLHQPADPQVSIYGYGWRCFQNDRIPGQICTHSGTNDLNYYNVTLAFEMKRAFVSFTNSGSRSEWKDGKLGDEAAAFLLYGDQPDCDEQIESEVYMTPVP